MSPLSFLGQLISPVTNLAGKLIMDKDKYAELQFKKAKFKHDEKSQLLTITTTPNIDAFVKLLYAIKDVIIPMFRPLGSFGLAAFAAYCAVKDITIPTEIQALLFGSPVAWGVSRHINKQTDTKKGSNPVTEEDFS